MPDESLTPPQSVPPKREIVQVRCPECGGGLRNHVVVVETPHDDGNDDVGIYVHYDYQVVRCEGCGTFRFREVYTNSEDTDDEYKAIPRISVYPEHTQELRPTQKELAAIGGKVGRIYSETLKTLNAGANTLTGGGLRAIVEGICEDRGIKGGNLAQKIDGLASQGLLAKPQADLLHEHRFIGNAALHELEEPAQEDLLDAVDIVETLLQTIYILPKKAERMRKRRQLRAQGLPDDIKEP